MSTGGGTPVPLAVGFVDVEARTAKFHAALAAVEAHWKRLMATFAAGPAATLTATAGLATALGRVKAAATLPPATLSAWAHLKGLLGGLAASARVLAAGMRDAVLATTGGKLLGYLADWGKALGALALASRPGEWLSGWLGAFRSIARSGMEVLGRPGKWLGGWAKAFGDIGRSGIKLVARDLFGGWIGAFGDIARSGAKLLNDRLIKPLAPIVGALGVQLGKGAVVFGSALKQSLGIALGAVLTHGVPLFRKLAGAAGSLLAGVFSAGGRLAGAFTSVLGWMTTRFTQFASWLGSKLGAALGGVTRLLGGTGRLALGGMAALGLGGGLSLAGIGYEAAQAETQLVTLQRVTGQTAERAGAMADQFNRLASVSGGVPLDTIYNLAEFGARLGVSTDQLQTFTYDLTRMGMVLHEIPIEEAATRTARLLAVFNEGNDQAMRLASALNALDMSSTASARDILDITTRLSGMASVMGMTLPRALALSTALREAGIPIETAGTSISQILTRMASRKDARQFARVAGVSTADWMKTIGTDPLKAIVAFEGGLKRLSNVQAVQVLEKLHLDGQRVRGTILQLGQVTDRLNHFLAISEDEWKTMASIEQGAALVNRTLNAQYHQMANNFWLMVRALGTALLPLFKGGLAGLSGLFRDVTAAIRSGTDSIRAWADWLGKGIRLVGLLYRDWALFTDLGRAFVSLQWERFLAVLDAIAGRIRDIAQQKWDAFKQGFWGVLQKIWDFLVDLGGRIGNYLSQLFTNLVARLKAELQNLLAMIPLLGIAPARGVPAIAPRGGAAGPFAGMHAPLQAPVPFRGPPRPPPPIFGRPERIPGLQAAMGGILGRLFLDARKQDFEVARDALQLQFQADAARGGLPGAPMPPGRVRNRRQAALQALRQRRLAAVGLTPAQRRAARNVALARQHFERRQQHALAAMLARGAPGGKAFRRGAPGQIGGLFDRLWGMQAPDLTRLGIALQIPEGRKFIGEQARAQAEPLVKPLEEAVSLLDQIRQALVKGGPPARWAN